jgi:hypothetical protein
MRRIVVLMVFALVVAACGDEVPGSTPAEMTTTTAVADSTPPTSDEDRITVAALAVGALVRDFNTFGSGHRFTEVLIQSRIDPNAGGEGRYTADPGRPLTVTEKVAIEDALVDVGPYRWIDDPAEFRTEDLLPLIEGSAIIGVGEVVFDDDGALVPVSLWCGGVCGIWMDLRVVYEGGDWSVVGPEGPMMIS